MNSDTGLLGGQCFVRGRIDGELVVAGTRELSMTVLETSPRQPVTLRFDEKVTAQWWQDEGARWVCKVVEGEPLGVLAEDDSDVLVLGRVRVVERATGPRWMRL